jgi:hypothetical protein
VDIKEFLTDKKMKKYYLPIWCRRCYESGEYNKKKSKGFSLFVIKSNGERFCKNCKKNKDQKNKIQINKNVIPGKQKTK